MPPFLTYPLIALTGVSTDCISIGTRHISGSGSWRTVIAIGLLWPIILGTGIQTMPESPRWLAVKGRYDAARISLARSRGIPMNEVDKNTFIQREVQFIMSLCAERC